MALDLSDEQRARMGKLADELRKRQWEIQGKIMDRESELRRLGEEQRRAQKALSELQGQMGQVAADVGRRARDLLTEEQRQRIQGAGPQGMPPTAFPRGYGGRPAESKRPGPQMTPWGGPMGGPGGGRRSGSGGGSGGGMGM
jgi:hypothetical protein